MNTRCLPSAATKSILAAAALLLGGVSSASAEISFVNMFRSDDHTQTGNGNMLSSDGSFLTFDLFAVNATDYTSAQTSYPGTGSPAVLTSTAATPTVFGYSTGFYSTRAALNADFPTGTYTYSGTNGTTTDSTSISYAADAYPSTVPYLTGTDYAALQGVNPTAPFAFHFSADTPAAGVSQGLLFFTIFNAISGDVVYDAGFQPSTTASLTLPANTLAGGTQYAYQLIFSDRVQTASPNADFDGQLGFDIRTVGYFTTGATPEPTSLLIAAAGMGFVGRRRVR